jgi:hypothetical protein
MSMFVAMIHTDAPTSTKTSARRGATLLEYLLVISLICVTAIVGIGYFGSETSNLTQNTSSAISKSLSAAPGTNTLPVGGILPSGALDDEEKSKDKTKDGKTKTTDKSN